MAMNRIAVFTIRWRRRFISSLRLQRIPNFIELSMEPGSLRSCRVKLLICWSDSGQRPRNFNAITFDEIIRTQAHSAFHYLEFTGIWIPAAVLKQATL